MANGYIGKISAVVTANTSDLSRKLAGAVTNVDKFANRLAASVERSSQQAQNSLNNIFTPLQRLERNLQAGLSGNVFNRENVDQYVRSVRQAVSISEQINKPLAGGASAFQKLSLEVQAAFLPALNRAQGAVVNLSTTLQQQGSVSERSFGQVEQVVNRTTAAIRRLAQAQQLASQSLTGNELQFSNPRLFQTLSESARVTQSAAALPAAQLEDGSIARQVRALQQYRNAAVEANAAVESLRLEPNVSPEVVLAAERRLQSLIETARRAGVEVETAVANSQRRFTVSNVQPESAGLGLFGTQAGTAEQRALARARELSAQFAKLPESAQQGLSGLAGIAANLANRVDQGRASAEQLETVLARLQARIEAATPAAAIARANEQLTIVPDQPPPPPPRTDLGDQLQRAGRNRIEQLTGSVNIDSSDRLSPQFQRDIDALATRVGAVRQQLETLPNSVRTQFIPALRRAQERLVALQNSPAATADQLRRAAREVQNLERSAERARQALAIPSARDFLGNINTQRAQGELEALRGILARVGATAGGSVAQAYDKLAAATRKAVANGTTGLPEVQELLKRLQVEAAKAAAQTGKISFGAALRQIRRGGDVATGSFQNVGLAVNQLAFAVDDFFSVTGGAEQRIRAIGNNITQFGLIIGQTKGLFVALAAVLSAQAIVALIKYSNANTDAADRIKALNDALARQKSLVEELAEAYRSVADAIASSGLTSETRDLRDRNKQIDELRKKQNEQQRERVAGLDREVQRERGIQAARQRELEKTADPGERVRLEREIRQSRDRERAAADAAVARPGGNAAQAVEAAGDARFRVEVAAIEDLAIRAAAAAGPGDQGQVRQIEAQRQRQLDEAEARREEFVRTGVGRVQGAGGARAQVTEAGRIIDEAQQEIADSITTGIAGFFDGANQERRAQLARLEKDRAQLEKDIFRAATNEVAIEATKTAIEASAAIGGALQILTDSIGDPRTSIIGERLEAITQSILEAEKRISTAQETGDVDAAEAAKAQIDAANEQKDALISGARSVETFAAVLDRVSNDLANTVAQEARSAADQARRDANAADARDRNQDSSASGRDLLLSQRRRDRLEADARAADERRLLIEQQNSRERERFEADAVAGNLGADAQALIRQRDEAQAVLDNQESTAKQRAEATRQRDEANFRLDRRFEDSDAGRRARERGDQANVVAQQDAQQEDRIARGLELTESPAARAGRELAENLDRVDAGFDELVGAGVLDQQTADAQREQARRRQIDEAFRSQAPAIAGLADSVANALLQGPSRAALNATDVSTVEGARELNRLIRGDDAARDQNLEELRRQSGQLTELIQAVRDQGVQIAD